MLYVTAIVHNIFSSILSVPPYSHIVMLLWCTAKNMFELFGPKQNTVARDNGQSPKLQMPKEKLHSDLIAPRV